LLILFEKVNSSNSRNILPKTEFSEIYRIRRNSNKTEEKSAFHRKVIQRVSNLILTRRNSDRHKSTTENEGSEYSTKENSVGDSNVNKIKINLSTKLGLSRAYTFHLNKETSELVSFKNYL
jgi:hypothetical protein